MSRDVVRLAGTTVALVLLALTLLAVILAAGGYDVRVALAALVDRKSVV